eukprot:Gb_00681 [translate_table: standard]
MIPSRVLKLIFAKTGNPHFDGVCFLSAALVCFVVGISAE